MVKWLKQFAHLWRDLALLVIGIYLALWMENTVEYWNDKEKEQSYLNQLSLDLESDRKQIVALLPKLQEKVKNLESAIHFFQQSNLKYDSEEASKKAVMIASHINNYFFFRPQEFTFLSMRESGDFKLITSDRIKRDLLQLNDEYRLIGQLQKNYLQGLDDEFIPMWVRHADMVSNELIYPEIIKEPIFKNMVAFSWNETSQRSKQLTRTIIKISALHQKLISNQPN